MSVKCSSSVLPLSASTLVRIARRLIDSRCRCLDAGQGVVHVVWNARNTKLLQYSSVQCEEEGFKLVMSCFSCWHIPQTHHKFSTGRKMAFDRERHPLTRLTWLI